MYSGMQVRLNEEHKWSEFYPNTEMIVTRKRGRVIFPHLDFRIEGLEPHTLYTVHIHLERVDDVKYKFDGGEWKEAAKGDPMPPIEKREHQEGTRTGSHWMAGPVSFATLKITNDPMNKDPKTVLVQSMHKYQPVLTVSRVNEPGLEFRPRLASFIAVTAYQNEEVIRLKVAHNKFASGHAKRRQPSPEQEAKRSRPSSTESSPPVTPPQWDYFYNNQYAYPLPQHYPQFMPFGWNFNNYYENPSTGFNTF